MDWLVTAGGALLVTLALLDLFHTLWHPSGQGRVTGLVMRGVWRATRRRSPGSRVRGLAGPLAMIGVVLAWGGLVVVGFALVYTPHLPESFSYSSGLEPAARSEVLDGFYLSLVTVATLGFGDITPTAPWLRLVVPVQALVGFALLTAAVTWVMQIYPALTRRRALAARLVLLERTRLHARIPTLDSGSPAVLLDTLASELTRVRIDLLQYAETYYFQDGHRPTSLAAMAEYGLVLSDCGHRSPREDVRLAATTLRYALDDLAALLRQEFVGPGETTLEVLQSFAADHGHSRA